MKCCPKCKQPLPPRACEACGADISDRQRGARVCSKYCYARLPEVKEKHRAYTSAYHRSPRGKATREAWLARPGNRDKVRAAQRRYAARKRAKQKAQRNGE